MDKQWNNNRANPFLAAVVWKKVINTQHENC